MTPTQRTIFKVLGLALLFGIVIDGWIRLDRRLKEKQIKLELGQKTALSGALAQARQHLETLQRARSEPAQSHAMGGAARSAGVKTTVDVYDSASASAMLAIASVRWDDVVLEKESGLQQRYLDALSPQIEKSYGPFWRAAGLSGAAIKKFQEIMMENAERVLDIKAVGRDQNLSSSDPAMKTLLEQADAQLRGAEIALLGAEGYQQLKDYDRQAPAREMVENLAGTLAFTDSPLDVSQVQELTRILAEANSQYRAGGNADRFSHAAQARWLDIALAAKGFSEPTDWDQVLSQASVVLTAPQLALFKSRAEGERTSLALYNTMQKGTPEPVIGFILGGRK